MVRGSCLCGRFSFEADGFNFMSHCDCGYCRKAHGAAFATYVAAPASRFRWLSGDGEQAFYESSPGAKRPFCPDCGSKVPGPASGDAVFFPAGLLDGDPAVRPSSHIYTSSRVPWLPIDDGLESFAGPPPGMQDPGLPARPRPGKASAGSVAGSCLCAAVAWEASELLPRMGSCHCSRCRKARSAAFSTQVFAPPGKLRWLDGRPLVEDYVLPGAAFFGNSFCSRCGSPVPRDLAGAPMILIPAGALDDDPGVRPQAHIYVASRAAWHEIGDALPCFDEMPPA